MLKYDTYDTNKQILKTVKKIEKMFHFFIQSSARGSLN